MRTSDDHRPQFATWKIQDSFPGGRRAHVAGPEMGLSWKAWAALGVFVVQNGLAGIFIRYSKLHATVAYDSSVAVLMQEVAVKLPVSLLLFAVECGGPIAAVRALRVDIAERSIEWLQASTPRHRRNAARACGPRGACERMAERSHVCAPCAQLAVPALLYTLQNNMLYVGFTHVEVAVGQVRAADPAAR